jgi:hypothetical protein|nr:MAG TPA: hypothetical protein [Caudoviricetes sp.]
MVNYENIMLEKEQEFEQLSAHAKEKEAAHNEEMAQIQEELLRIQGEYRMLAKLKEQSEAVVTDNDTTVNIKDSDMEIIEAE